MNPVRSSTNKVLTENSMPIKTSNGINMMKAIIIAGGRGSRLGKITEKIPKPMIKIGKLTILEHQINLLKRSGIKEIIILAGYLSEIIENFLKRRSFGVKIKCLKSNPEIGNADRLKLAEKKLSGDFLVLYGDTMLDMDLKRLSEFHKNKKSFCTLVIHPNDHPYDSDLAEIDDNQRIIAFHPKPRPENKYFNNLVNAGVYVMSSGIFRYIKSKKGVELDLGKNIFPKLFKKEKIFGYNTPEYIKDMGTPERLEQVRKDCTSGKIKKLNMKNKKAAIFLDRDGTINYDPGNLSDIKGFRLLPQTAEAIKLINSSGYLAIVVSNQPMVAKGLLEIKDVKEIHKKMETLLGMEGAKLDAVYFCPHHPDKGYPKENPEYTIQCDCRKPQIGMLKKAQKDFNIDLSKSCIIGDSERDIIAGKNAGIKTILIRKNQEKLEKCRVETKRAENLYSAVKLILK